MNDIEGLIHHGSAAIKLPTFHPAPPLISAGLLTGDQHLIDQLTGQVLGVVVQQAKLADHATFHARTGQSVCQMSPT